MSKAPVYIVLYLFLYAYESAGCQKMSFEQIKEQRTVIKFLVKDGKNGVQVLES